MLRERGQFHEILLHFDHKDMEDHPHVDSNLDRVAAFGIEPIAGYAR